MQTSAVRAAAIGSSLLFLTTTAWAQSTPVQVPKVMLSIGLGAATDHNTTSQLRSIALEVLATRNLVLEAEAMQWDMSTERETSLVVRRSAFVEPRASPPSPKCPVFLSF